MKKETKDFMKDTTAEKIPSLWLRFAANTIDSFILLVIAIPVMIPMIIVVFKNTIDALNNGNAEVVYTQGEQLIIGFTSLALLFITIAYYTFTTSSRLSATPGKSILGMKVIDVHGKKLNRSAAFKRYMYLAGLGMPYSLLGGAQNTIASAIGVFFSIVQTIYLIVSASQAQTDPEKRMIHDRLANTRVVYKTKVNGR